MTDAWLRALVALPFGLAIGSFMTVVIDRVPKGESVVAPRSRCPGCGGAIAPRDNIPVISWILLRGRCRACGEPISVEYPLTELATTVLIVGTAAHFDRIWVGVMMAALLSLMPAISIIDVRHRIIPNKLMYPALIAFPVYIVVAWLVGGGTDPARAAEGFLLYGGGLFLVALISRGMGMGDVKLAALLGLVMGSLGLRYVGVAAGAAILLGGLGGVAALVVGRGRKSAIPFGPYLAAGAVVAAFLTEPVASWYLQRVVNP
jgi:leader peptidase (prepilin peptidase) / N-methyltransferase